MSMITASLWVPRGAAATFPTKYDVDAEELARISNLAKLQLEDAQQDLEESEAAKNGVKNSSEDEDEVMGNADVKLHQSHDDADDDLKAYDLENYDSGDADDGEHVSMVGNARSLAYYDSNKDDPYIKMDDGQDDDEESDELQVLATDNMVVAAKVEDEVPYLEIYVYEDEADNLYVHHDIMLPAVPLCVEWLDLPVGKSHAMAHGDSRGNFVAVGTMDPDIELWDLDTIDSLYPNAILGQEKAEDVSSDPSHEIRKKKKGKNKKAKPNDDFHVDAVLSLAANRQHRNLLASASADRTVKLWDLNTTKCAKSYDYHTDKVCSIAWHPEEATILLSGGYDRQVFAADMRAREAAGTSWHVESDVETLKWNPHDPRYFFVTTEKGLLHMIDTRNASSDSEQLISVWDLQAHDEPASSLDVNHVIPGFLVTGSSDKEVKLWDLKPTGPSMIVSRNVGVGRVFSTQFAPDAEVAFRLAVSGSKGALQVWDTSTNAGVRRAFADRVSTKGGGGAEDRIIGVREDSSDDEEEGGMERGGAEGRVENGWESMDDE